MPRRIAKVDDNQGEIVAGLRAIGCSVQSIATVGKGCPDIIVGIPGHNILMEIKDGSKPKSARALTGDEREWHAKWRGPVHTIETFEQASNLVNEYRRKRIK